MSDAPGTSTGLEAPLRPTATAPSDPTDPPVPGSDRTASGPSRAAGGLGGLRWAELALLVVPVVVVLRGPLASLLDGPALQAGATVFLAVVLQALPFLALGVLLSGLLSAYVPASWLRRALPSNPSLAVPVAGVGGLVLPGCECASVPVAASLARRGVAPAAAIAFLLAAPAVNPVVLVATSVAFPGDPEMVWARLVASMGAAWAVGWLWQGPLGRGRPLPLVHRTLHAEGAARSGVFLDSVRHDLLHAGGFLVLGGLLAAVLNVVVPPAALDAIASREVVAVLALAGLAVALAICSEADAFVAASLSQFSLRSRLVFLVVGPMVDVKLVALQAGTFGARFAARFAPVVLVVAMTSAVVVGTVLL